MSESRIIKKYPNRRLYDTEISSYITLEDVKRLVMEEIPLQIVDVKTQKDITHNTLLQIIIEQEESGPPLFTTENLAQMIRFYGGSMQQMLSTFFAQGMKLVSEQQHVLKEKITPGGHPESNDPIRYIADLTQKNISHWKEMQQQWQQLFITNMQKKGEPSSCEEE